MSCTIIVTGANTLTRAIHDRMPVLLDKADAQADLCHEAPARPGTRPNRSSATRSIDNSLGGIFLH